MKKVGDLVTCVYCIGKHPLEVPTRNVGSILFYRCEGKLFVGSVGGRVIFKEANKPVYGNELSK